MKKYFLLFVIQTLFYSTICFSQDVPEEARKHYVWGQTAAESSSTEAGYTEAVREFETAIRLAPGWADPYYDLGVLQDKKGNYSEALKSLNKYIELAPGAANVSQVRTLCYKVEYKQNKEKERMEIISIITSEGGTVSAENGEKYVLRNFDLKENEIFGVYSCYGAPEYNQTVPVSFDGSVLKYSYSYYLCPLAPGLDEWPCEFKVSFVATVAATNPLKLSFKETVRKASKSYDGSVFEGTVSYSK